MKKVYLLGAIPPPIGGVSVFCARRMEELRSSGNDVVHFDSRSRVSIFLLIFRLWHDALQQRRVDAEINISNYFALALLLLSGIAGRCIFWDHNGSRRLNRTWGGRLIFRLFSKRVKQIIIVNSDLLQQYKWLSLSDREKILVETPFLRPTSSELKESCLAWDQVWPDRPSGRSIVLSSAWKVQDDANEPDLYGILKFLDLVDALAPEFPAMTFVLLVASNDGGRLYNEICRRSLISKKNPNFHYFETYASQICLLPNVALLVRLTSTDGDSVSVREALLYGAQVVASDVCTRPVGVISVSTSQSEYIDKIRLMIDNFA